MTKYIEFVADRLLSALGHSRFVWVLRFSLGIDRVLGICRDI